MHRLYHDCARTLKRSLSGKLAIVELSGDLVLLAIPRSVPAPSLVSRVLACLVVCVPATLPVSCTVESRRPVDSSSKAKSHSRHFS